MPSLRAIPAKTLDAQDPLSRFRNRFYLPPDHIYLDGNSLGLLSRDSEDAVHRALADWKERAIGGWLEADPPWFTLAETLAGQVASLIGAEPDEVAVANSTTVNLHQALGTLYPATGRDGGRTRILAFAGEFPSDLHAIRGHLRSGGLDPGEHLMLVAAGADRLLDEAEIECALSDPRLKMAVLPAVVYTSGQLLDLAKLIAAAHANGVLIGFDLSHSIGALPHALSAIGADFALWCHYKYLNAGPGAIGGLYLNRRHFGRGPGLPGWWGTRKDQMFDAGREAEFAEGAAALQVGTPDVLSLAALSGALAITREASIEAIREKSLALTASLMAGLADLFSFANPIEDHRRGGHVALIHPEARRICRALGAAGIIADHRPPDIVRLAPVALYNSFADCDRAIETLQAIMRDERYLQLPDEPSLVP